MVSATVVTFAVAIAPRRLQSFGAVVQAVKAPLSAVVSTTKVCGCGAAMVIE